MVKEVGLANVGEAADKCHRERGRNRYVAISSLVSIDLISFQWFLSRGFAEEVVALIEDVSANRSAGM